MSIFGLGGDKAREGAGIPGYKAFWHTEEVGLGLLGCGIGADIDCRGLSFHERVCGDRSAGFGTE